MSINVNTHIISNEPTRAANQSTSSSDSQNTTQIEPAITDKALVARQPILDKNQAVFCYQLLFHSHLTPQSENNDADTTTIEVIQNSLNVVGLTTLTRNRHAMVALTPQLLQQGIQTVLPANQTIILLDINNTDNTNLADICQTLKDTGYTLAVSQWALDTKYQPVLNMADILVIDCSQQIPDPATMNTPTDIMHLATQLQSQSDFRKAADLDYDYFQGTFFARPEVVRGKEIPTLKANQLQFIAEVQKPEIQFDQLESIIKRDVSLSYKLLKYLNSAFFGFSNKVDSIKHALILLGERPLKQWATLIATTEMCSGKPSELTRTCLVRAQFCESVADAVDLADHKYDLFLVGLLSAIDAMVDQPLEKLLEQMPIGDDIKNALLKGNNKMGKVFKLFLAYEDGEFTTTGQMAHELGVEVQYIAKTYCDAIAWADDIIKA